MKQMKLIVLMGMLGLILLVGSHTAAATQRQHEALSVTTVRWRHGHHHRYYHRFKHPHGLKSYRYLRRHPRYRGWSYRHLKPRFRHGFRPYRYPYSRYNKG